MGKVAGVARMPFLNAVFETGIAESHADGQPVSAASGLYESPSCRWIEGFVWKLIGDSEKGGMEGAKAEQPLMVRTVH